MDRLGEYLKAARTEKGLSLKQVSEKTCIGLTFLQAIEDGDYSVIPGEVFVSGFIRSYAKELGLSEKEVMALYRESRGDRPGPVPEAEEPVSPPGETGKAVGPPVRLSFAVTALVVVVAIGVYLAVQEMRDTAPPGVDTAAVQESTTPGPAPDEAAFTQPTSTPAASIPQPETAPPTVASARPQAADTAVKPVRLKLTAIEDSWYAYRADRKMRRTGTIKAGETLSLTADKEILLDLGNAGGVNLSFNGEPVRSFGPAGAPVKNILFSPEAHGKPMPAAEPSPVQEQPVVEPAAAE